VDAGQVWERGEELFQHHRFAVLRPGWVWRYNDAARPVRIDAAYNGYPLERGPLLYQPPLGSRIRWS
jgi:hypothetical protein